MVYKFATFTSSSYISIEIWFVYEQDDYLFIVYGLTISIYSVFLLWWNIQGWY